MASPGDDRESCCKPKTARLDCPLCGRRGRQVGTATLDHHLGAAERARLGETAGFCPNAACAAVYFDGAAVVRKGETLLPVTQKDPGDDVHVCYCFGFRRGDIRRDLEATGTTGIPELIKEGIAKGSCACETKNPQGSCCLGNVAQAVKAVAAERSAR